MTEDEAKTQLCIGPSQLGRKVTTNISKHMGPTGGTETVRYCIGSACKMAWRWAKPAGEDWTMEIQNGVDHWVRRKPRGYCGLAGKP